MTVVVTHTTPADGTFSATGAAAWDAAHALSGVGTMAEQDANNVAITGGAINNTTIGATTPSTGVFTTLTATGQTILGGTSGAEGLRVVPFASQTSRLEVTGGLNGGKVQAYVAGTGNTELWVSSLGTGAVRFQTNSGATEQLRVTNTASAVNYVQVTGAATGSDPTMSAQGSDSNINFTYLTKGSAGEHRFSTNTGGNIQFKVTHTGSAANYLAVSGGATGSAPTLKSTGSDTNISQVFQSKGTGAIDLAAGSSGVNISNGGTVTAITRTATSGGYTSAPTITVSAPTTAGGVQATVTGYIWINSVTLASGGTGYTVGDVLSIAGGSYVTNPVRITVTGVSAGVITSFTFVSFDLYNTAPSNPASVTGGTGSGATFTLNFSNSSTYTITNAGSGYVEQPTVTFSGGGGSGAAAYAVVGNGTNLKSLNTFNLGTNSGTHLQLLDGGLTNTNFLRIQGGSSVYAGAAGSDTNVQAIFYSRGTGSVTLATANGSAYQLNVAHTASAVNYVQVTGAATGNAVNLSAQGSDTNIQFNINSKNAFGIQFGTGGGTQFLVSNTAAAANYLRATGGATGFGPVLSAQGSDTNIPLVLQPKGTGALQAQQTDSTATGGNARGANAVDWQTSRGSAAQVASANYSVVAGGASNRATGTYAVSSGGNNNTSSGFGSIVAGGNTNTASNSYAFLGAGQLNTVSGYPAAVVTGVSNTAAGFHNFIGAGFTNSGTSGSAVTTQSATMNGTTAVTLSGSNASIKVGQWISGTSIADETYVAAISGTSLTLSKNASGSSTSTLSFYTPHGVVVGGGNNQATGSYSFIGGGGDAGTAANRNVASGDWSFVGGGAKNTASGIGAVIAGGGTEGTGFYANVASGNGSVVSGGTGNVASATLSTIVGGGNHVSNAVYAVVVGSTFGNTRSIQGNTVLPANNSPIANGSGISQSAVLVLGTQTTDATATVLRSNTSAAGTTNQVILPNNSAYYFKVEIIANVTGGGNTSGWELKGVIKRGANAASTTIVGSVTSTLIAQDAGASTWAVSATADTTNGGLKITCTGQASTTIRWVAKASTTEVTF